MDLYGGAGLFDQSKTMELSFTQPIHEIRVGEELIYQDGRLITEAELQILLNALHPVAG